MSLDKPIEILTRVTKDYQLLRDPDLTNALKLGIEALKSHQKAIAAGWFPPGSKLPGETED